jgi:methionyl-tRNA formyltransferase
MGTPDFAVPTLRTIVEAGHDVACVYTQPPRKAGRGHKVQPSPVHLVANEFGIEVRTPQNFKQLVDTEAFGSLELDVAVVVAYGLLLPLTILDAPKFGCLNLHGSLLPRWRGAAPIQRAIMAGDEETGVMVMQMDEGLDTGPVLLSERMSISKTDTSGTISARMSDLGAHLMSQALARLEDGDLTAQEQAEEGVTYAKKITKEEAKILWSKSAQELDCQIRGLDPTPGAWFEVPLAQGPVRVKVLEASPIEQGGKIGEIITAPLVVGCGQGALDITKVQRAGKSACSAADFIRGIDLPVGSRLA